MKMYNQGKVRRSIIPTIIKVVVVVAVFVAAAGVAGVQYMRSALLPVSSGGVAKEITIEQGASVGEIGEQLEKEGLIQHSWAFQRYVQFKRGAGYLQAGTYQFSPSESTQDIIAQLTHGKVATKLVTILPGQRVDQVKKSLINQGFTEEEVVGALEPTQYESLPLFVDKPAGASLEGYIFPDSYQRTKDTTAKDIISAALTQMSRQLTPDITEGFKKQGVTTYQAIILASIVEKEAVTKSDREQAAQVFYKRLQLDMQFGSDVTAFYGSELAGQGQDVTYDTPYNTRIHTGFPPTPISNVSLVSLTAVAHPATTDWVFFVAGDDGVTHFSRTVEEHEALTKQYCTVLCQ